MKKVILLAMIMGTFIFSCNKNENNELNSQSNEKVTNMHTESLGIGYSGMYIQLNFPDSTQGTFYNFGTDSLFKYKFNSSITGELIADVIEKDFSNNISIIGLDSNSKLVIEYNNENILCDINYDSVNMKLNIGNNSENIQISNVSSINYSSIIHSLTIGGSTTEVHPVVIVFGVALLVSKIVDSYCAYQQWSQANDLVKSGCSKILYTWCGACCYNGTSCK